MNYRSISDLNFSIVRNLHRIPRDVELIVGVPRSGLLAANLLALHLNLPLADLEGFKAGRLLKSGMRMDGAEKGFEDIRNVVVLDDSVGSGKAMRRAKEELRELAQEKNVRFGAVYVRSELAGDVDFFFEECPYPRAFEWNMMHHVGVMRNACVEIDGVLARLPTETEKADPVRYEGFLEAAEPLLPCTSRIKCIITSRREEYRPQTERWLSKQNIEYAKLIMAGPEGSEKSKAKVYASERENMIFVEGDLSKAVQIANASGKMVYCVETREMIYPHHMMGKARWIKNRLISIAGGVMPRPMRTYLKKTVYR